MSSYYARSNCCFLHILTLGKLISTDTAATQSVLEIFFGTALRAPLPYFPVYWGFFLSIHKINTYLAFKSRKKAENVEKYKKESQIPMSLPLKCNYCYPFKDFIFK